MGAKEPETIEFTRKVDEKGRLVIPQGIREGLTIDERKSLVKFEAKKIKYLDDKEDSA